MFASRVFHSVTPMPNKMGPKCANSLIDVTDDVGIPDELVTDGAGEFTGRHTELVQNCCYNSYLHKMHQVRE
jgi:hypothetical protein